VIYPKAASWHAAQQWLARRLRRASLFTFAPSHRGLRSRCGPCSGERSRVSVPGDALGSGRRGWPGARLHCWVCAAGRGCSEFVQAAGLSLAWYSTAIREEAAQGSTRLPRPTTAHSGDRSSCGRAGNRDWQKGRLGRAAGRESSVHAVRSGKRALLPGGQLQQYPFDLASHQLVPLALAALHPNCFPKGSGPPPPPPDLPLPPDSCKACLWHLDNKNSRTGETPFPLPITDYSWQLTSDSGVTRPPSPAFLSKADGTLRKRRLLVVVNKC
jgi:hypothetical protein